MKKRIISFTLVLVICLSLLPAIPVQAVRFGDVAGVPRDYWPIFTPYETADKNNDSRGITTHGERVINYWLAGSSASRRASEWLASPTNHGFEINTVYNVSRRVALEYESRSDYANTIRFMQIQLAFIDPYKALISRGIVGGNADDMERVRQQIQNKLNAYQGGVSLYAEI